MKNYPEILAIQSDKKELIKVENFLRTLFNKENLPGNSFNKVLLVVSEAVLNSIEHGNKNDSKKMVTIEASCQNNGLMIEISDEGDGFDYNRLSDPTELENIKKEAGRGIFIMRTICSKLDFHDRGKCVEIKIELA